MWLLAILMGDRIRVFFFYKNMYGFFEGPKKLAIIMRRPYYRGGRKAGFYCIIKFYQVKQLFSISLT